MEDLQIDFVSHSEAFAFSNIDFGNLEYSHFGVVYGTSKSPKTSNNLAVSFSSESRPDITHNFKQAWRLDNLLGDTKYFARPYLYLDGELHYGKVHSFITKLPIDPTVSIQKLYSISFSGAQILVNVDDTGGQKIVRTGVVASKSGNPTLDNYDQISDWWHTWSYQSNRSFFVTNLESSTTYHARSFVETENEIFYSEIDSVFTTLDGSPIIRTNYPNSLSASEIRVNASIQSYGETAITRMGFEYATSLPSANSMFVEVPFSSIQDNGIFSTTIENLSRNTGYQIRAFAENSRGRGYGEIVEAYTKNGLASLAVDAVLDTTSTTATIQATVYDNGGSALLETGLVWSESSSPTISDNKMDTPNIERNIELTIAGLEPESRYYVRAFARNEFGYHYSEDFEIMTARP